MPPIQPPDLPRPKGHYSPGFAAQGFVFVSGQLPMDPATGEVVPGGLTAQTEQALRNVEQVLQAAGSGLDKVVQMTIYLVGVEGWGELNAAYARVMGDHRPARAVVPVPELHYGALLEVQAIATL